MKYLTKSLMQRFMSHMSEQLSFIQDARVDTEAEIRYCKANFNYYDMATLYKWREKEAEHYKKASDIQMAVKNFYACNFSIPHNYLQKMEKVVTAWIKAAEWQKYYAHQDYLDNRYDTFYRNKTKQAKQRLAKLVELQQAIRKQKAVCSSNCYHLNWEERP